MSRSLYEIRVPKIDDGYPWSRPASAMENYLKFSDRERRVILVESLSTKKNRAAVIKLARYFRREFRYDFVQYSLVENDGKCKAYLFIPDGYCVDEAFGACCFRWRQYGDAPGGWELDWIWLHPYERNRGHLKKLWPFFVERFGHFHVTHPRSPAMESFVAKHHAEATQ